MIVKRKYGTTYCPDNPLVKYLRRGLVIDTKLNDIVMYHPPVKARTFNTFKELNTPIQGIGTMVNLSRI